MKKILTVSLFAIMAVGAANADIASTDFVKGQTGSEVAFKAGDFTGVASTATNLKGAVDAITGSLGTVESGKTVVEMINEASTGATDALKAYSTTEQMNEAITDNAVNTVGAGTANGTIAVDGTDVKVTGLGSAAYTEAGAYDVAGSAKAVDDKLQALDGTGTLDAGKYYTAYTQTDGKISMTPGDFITSVEDNKTSMVAPTTSAVVEYVSTEVGALGVDGVKQTVNELGQDVAALEEDKADKATTLAGYGITDAMTATAITGAIGTAKDEAISAASAATGNVISGLDSSAAATSGSVLTGVTITDGKITAKQEMALTALANFPVECATSKCALTNNGTTLSWEVVK